MASSPPIEFTIPPSVELNTESDRKLHESIKLWDGYEAIRLPKAVFFKSNKITSKDFLESNPLICKVKQHRRIVAYGYQRANRAKEHGEPLVQKKFGIRQSLADALEAESNRTGKPQVELVEIAVAALLKIEVEY
ncbi:MAG: hypothetical protein F6K00_19545 [Leptolyngbya sp. SIOISBB]|nr:hypothetical protein [Leptolyngbya sp. SIOISBB]